ncbi:Peptidyl-prolyl cis-trans isomerase FKBP8 (PPIase FKBP8) (FK506-binding protein 8) (FKBP-8) (Rotamase) [Durusdinium trenchii]|uniref:Peptidyl-prolyl cis-trans isomerase FKBP8 (PPIase FKBP8) (FK506-binding protein 8) (FKBP-8) (Rotamase) n=1 Tax=Durusdinium trenchii TaxID=1381693 RepID=A0ABP0RM72_9DINO
MGTGVDNVDDEEKVADPDAWHSWKPRVFKEVQMQYRHLLVGPDPEEAWQAARHSAVERSYCRMCIKRPRRAETETLGFFLGEEDGFRDDGMVEPFQPPQEADTRPVPRWLTEAALLLKNPGRSSSAEVLVEGEVMQVSLLSTQQGLLLLPEGMMFRRLSGSAFAVPPGSSCCRDCCRLRAAWRVWFARNNELVLSTGSVTRPEEAVELVLDEDELIMALELALKHLEAGASCCIRVSEHWGVGPLLPSGNPSLRGAAVWIYLVLHEVTNEPLPLEHPDDTSRLDFARRKKEQGNLHFAKGDVASLARAVRRYASGAAAAEAAEGDEAAQLLTMMCLNGAQAQLRRGRFEEAIQLCDRVLGTGPNIKAFFRRAAAREALGDYLGAEEDLRTAAKRSDDPALRQQLAKVQGLRQQQKEQQRQAYGGVFEKMKLQDEEKEKKEKEASERRAKEAQKEAEERAKEAQRMQAQEQERTQEEQAKATVESLMKSEEPAEDFRNVRLSTGPEEKGVTALMPPPNTHVTPPPPPVEDYQVPSFLLRKPKKPLTRDSK